MDHRDNPSKGYRNRCLKTADTIHARRFATDEPRAEARGDDWARRARCTKQTLQFYAETLFVPSEYIVEHAKVVER